MFTLIHVAVLAGTVLLLARFVPGVRIKSGPSAVLAAVVFSLLNWAVGWLVGVMLILPAILTLGLLAIFIPFLINVAILWLTDKLLDAFEIRDLKALLLSAGAITVANAFLRLLLRH
jgi:putative membrane protein